MNSNRRPATNLRLGPFSYPILDETKYTTDPPTPIVLKTRDESLTPKDRLSSAKSVKSSDKNSVGVFDYSPNIGSARSVNNSSQVKKRPSRNSNDIELLSYTKTASESVRSNSNINNNSSVIIEVEKQQKSKVANDGQRMESGKSGNPETEDDINKKPIKRRSRRHARQRMTDIV